MQPDDIDKLKNAKNLTCSKSIQQIWDKGYIAALQFARKAARDEIQKTKDKIQSSMLSRMPVEGARHINVLTSLQSQISRRLSVEITKARKGK